MAKELKLLIQERKLQNQLLRTEVYFQILQALLAYEDALKPWSGS